MTLTDWFDKLNISYFSNLNTANISSIKVGGKAKYVAYPKTSEEFLELIKGINKISEKYKIIGGCTNTFFSDVGYNGVIISTKKINKITFSNNVLYAEAGTSLSLLLKTAASLGIELGSGLFGIPGTVGGAIRNNAGAHSYEIGEIFDGGYFYDLNNDRVLSLSKHEMEFSYRHSILQNENLVFITGSFKGRIKSSEQIENEFRETLKKRRSAHPTEPSLGSFFKRSGDIIPAVLIDKAGLKGIKIGAASVSTKHAGFIINNGGATSRDVDSLAKKIEKTISEKYNVTLMREAEFVE